MDKLHINGVGEFYIINKYFNGTYLCTRTNPKERLVRPEETFVFDPDMCDFKNYIKKPSVKLK